MTTLDQLGAALRAAAEDGTRVEDIAVWARVRGRRRRVAVAVIVLVFVGAVGALVPPLLGIDEDRTVIDDSSGISLGSGPAVWPADDVNFSSPEELAGAFGDQVLGGGWSAWVTRVADRAILRLQHRDGRVIGLNLGEDADRWFILSGGPSIYVTDDARMGVDLRAQDVPPIAEVEILHRPADSVETLVVSVGADAGPWPLPGATGSADVGSVLILERDTRGRVVAVSGAALDGVGTDLDVGPPWTAESPDSLLASGAPLPEGLTVDLRLEVSAPIDTGSEARLGQSTDGAWVCPGVRLFREGTVAATCLPTWRFNQRGSLLALEGRSRSIQAVFLPFPVTDDQVKAFGRTAAGGYVIVLNRHAVDAGRVQLMSDGRSVEIDLSGLGVQPLRSFETQINPDLGSGPALWAPDDEAFATPDELAQAFAADVLGDGWEANGTEAAPGRAGLLYRNRFGDMLAFEALEVSGRWVIDHALAPDLVISMAESPTVQIENWTPGDDLAWVEVYNRPPGETRTFGGPVRSSDGPWLIPGAQTPTDVGSVMVIGRNADGAVIEVTGAATQGAGLDLNLGAPWRLGEVTPPGSHLGPGPDLSRREWDAGQVLELSDGSSLGIIRTVDGGWVCISRGGATGRVATSSNDCLPTWEFLAGGILRVVGVNDAGFPAWVMPVPVDPAQVAGRATVDGGGYVLVPTSGLTGGITFEIDAGGRSFHLVLPRDPMPR